jgi:hypothetical protein
VLVAAHRFVVFLITPVISNGVIVYRLQAIEMVMRWDTLMGMHDGGNYLAFDLVKNELQLPSDALLWNLKKKAWVIDNIARGEKQGCTSARHCSISGRPSACARSLKTWRVRRLYRVPLT